MAFVARTQIGRPPEHGFLLVCTIQKRVCYTG
jgi:hypothetical protein